MFGWFKKRKQGMMTDEQLAVYKMELSNVPKFQWLKTDKAGQVTYYKDVISVNNMVLVEFTDGSRVNYDLLGDAVMKIESDEMLLDIATESVDQMSQYNVPVHNAPAPTVSIGKPQPQKSYSPIHALLEKQKSNPVPIEFSIDLNLPPVSLYNVLSQSFENADEEIVEFIVAELDINKIKDAVKDAILNFYKSNG
jgi:hypothetical protein